jgi:hypothetical protein
LWIWQPSTNNAPVLSLNAFFTKDGVFLSTLWQYE